MIEREGDGKRDDKEKRLKKRVMKAEKGRTRENERIIQSVSGI